MVRLAFFLLSLYAGNVHALLCYQTGNSPDTTLQQQNCSSEESACVIQNALSSVQWYGCGVCPWHDITNPRCQKKPASRSVTCCCSTDGCNKELDIPQLLIESLNIQGSRIRKRPPQWLIRWMGFLSSFITILFLSSAFTSIVLKNGYSEEQSISTEPLPTGNTTESCSRQSPMVDCPSKNEGRKIESPNQGEVKESKNRGSKDPPPASKDSIPTPTAATGSFEKSKENVLAAKDHAVVKAAVVGSVEKSKEKAPTPKAATPKVPKQGGHSGSHRNSKEAAPTTKEKPVPKAAVASGSRKKKDAARPPKDSRKSRKSRKSVHKQASSGSVERSKGDTVLDQDPQVMPKTSPHKTTLKTKETVSEKRKMTEHTSDDKPSSKKESKS